MQPSSEAYLRMIMRETVRETLERMGFTIDDPQAIQADMHYVRRARESSEELSRWVRRAALSLLLAGTSWVLAHTFTFLFQGAL
jgi:hypothetical protein